MPTDATGTVPILEYPTPQTSRLLWGPFLVKPSSRSVILALLTVVSAACLALHHDPWQRGPPDLVAPLATDHINHPLSQPPPLRLHPLPPETKRLGNDTLPLDPTRPDLPPPPADAQRRPVYRHGPHHASASPPRPPPSQRHAINQNPFSDPHADPCGVGSLRSPKRF